MSRQNKDKEMKNSEWTLQVKNALLNGDSAELTRLKHQRIDARKIEGLTTAEAGKLCLAEFIFAAASLVEESIEELLCFAVFTRKSA